MCDELERATERILKKYLKDSSNSAHPLVFVYPTSSNPLSGKGHGRGADTAGFPPLVIDDQS